MQEQRGAVGSFPETLGYEHGSALSDDVNSPSDILSDYISLNVTNENDPNGDMWNIELEPEPEPEPESEPPSSPLSLGDHGSSSSSFSRKRKAESSSGIGTSNMFQRSEDGLNLDPTIPRLGLDIGRVLSENPSAENAHTNPSQQELLADNINQSDVSDPNGLTSHPVAPEPDSLSSRRAHQIQALIRHLHSTSRWTRSSASRTNRDHSLIDWSPNGGGGDGEAALNDGGGGGAASSEAGTSSEPPPNHHHPRRLSAYLRRSLLSATDIEAGGGQNSLFPRINPVSSTPSSSSSLSQDLRIPPLDNMPGQQSRSPLLVARHLEGGVAFYPSRSMTGGIERRGRLVSEIRSVLDSMRRGETLRFEDRMLLDQSLFYGIADNHDRHRDMRLDIDNMSYEELLALEERIGNVDTGLTEEKILKHLKQKRYLIKTGQTETEHCCICQEEYKDGDELGALECAHDFHHGCIKQWLQHKNSCPICKSTGFAAAK